MDVGSCCWKIRKPNRQERKGPFLSGVLGCSSGRKCCFLVLFNLISPHTQISLVWFLSFGIKINFDQVLLSISYWIQRNFEVFHIDFYILEQIKLFQCSIVYANFGKLIPLLRQNGLETGWLGIKLSLSVTRIAQTTRGGGKSRPHVLRPVA